MKMGEPVSGGQYLKSPAAILKLVEVIFLLVAIGTVGFFFNEYDDYQLKAEDRMKAFLGAAAASGILAIIFFLLFLGGLHKSISALTKVAMIVFVLLGIMMVVVSGLLTDTIKDYKKDVSIVGSFCDYLDLIDISSAGCTHLIVGVAFGFIAAAMFFVDAVVHAML